MGNFAISMFVLVSRCVFIAEAKVRGRAGDCRFRSLADEVSGAERPVETSTEKTNSHHNRGVMRRGIHAKTGVNSACRGGGLGRLRVFHRKSTGQGDPGAEYSHALAVKHIFYSS